MKNTKVKKIKSFKSFIKKVDQGKKIPDDAYEAMFCGFMGKKERTLEEKVDSKSFLPPQRKKHQVYSGKTYPKGTIAKNKEHGGDVEAQLEHHYHWDRSDEQQQNERRHINEFTQSSRLLNQHLIHQHLTKTNPEALPSFHRKHLTDEGYFTRPDNKAYRDKIDDTTSSALQRHTTPRDLHVYTGMMRNPERIKKVNGVKPAHLPAYTSTSINQDVATRFAKKHQGDSVHVYKSHYVEGEGYKHKIVPNAMEHHKTIGDLGMSHEKRSEAATALVGATHYRHLMHIHVPEGSAGAYVAHHSDHPHEKEFVIHKNAKLHIHPSPTVDHHSQMVIWHAKLAHDGVKPTRFAK